MEFFAEIKNGNWRFTSKKKEKRGKLLILFQTKFTLNQRKSEWKGRKSLQRKFTYGFSFYTPLKGRGGGKEKYSQDLF
jgi:hypothetical protein